jgi:chromosome segregation ATPase
MHRRLFPCLALLGLLLAGSAFAAEPAGDAQTREKLRSATLRLRDVETELATVKTEREALGERTKELEKQLAEMRKRNEEDRLVQTRRTNELGTKLDESEKDSARLQTDLKAENERLARTTALAQAREEARQRLADDNLALRNLVTAREVQNVELYRTATEILRRFEKFSLGEAISAKEPFVGRTRSKLEMLVFEYRDKLLAQRAPAKP